MQHGEDCPEGDNSEAGRVMEDLEVAGIGWGQEEEWAPQAGDQHLLFRGPFI